MVRTRPGTRAMVTAAALGSAGASAILAAPAAAHIPGDCAPNAICEYEDGGYKTSGKWWGTGSTDFNYRDDTYDFGARVGLDDSISAIVNNTNRWVVFAQDDQLRGYHLCMSPGSG